MNWLAAAAVAFAVVAPAGATDPPPPTVTVSPNPLGTTAHHLIQAEFTEPGGTYLVAVCLAGTDFSNIIAAAGRCSIEEQGVATGMSVSTTLQPLSTSFRPAFGGSRFQCREVACELAVLIGDGSITLGGTVNQVVTTPISFHLEMRGAGTGYRPGDFETVGTTIWGEHTKVEVVQCALGHPPRGCNVGDEIPAGEEVGGVTMRRFLDGDGDTIDCAAVACGSGIRVHGIPGASGPVDYLREAELLPPRINGGRFVSDVPTEGVLVAEGLPENTWGASLWQCVESEITEPFDPDLACGPSDATPSPGFDTAYDGTLTVGRELEVAGTTHDCKDVECVIALSGWTSAAMTARGDTFTVPLSYRPVVYVTGGFNADLAIGENIRFSVDTFLPPGGEWTYAQCTGEPTLETRADLCEEPVALAITTPPTRVFVAMPAKSVITTATGDHRCFEDGCSSMLVYTPPGADPEFVVRPFSLRAQLRVDPWRDLVDGQTIEVDEIGLAPTAPGAAAWVMQCGSYPQGGSRAIGCGNVGTVLPDHAGHFVGTIDIAATFAAGTEQVECTEDHGCGVAIVVIGPDASLLGGVTHPVRFASPS